MMRWKRDSGVKKYLQICRDEEGSGFAGLGTNKEQSRSDRQLMLKCEELTEMLKRVIEELPNRQIRASM
jgi:hypothetical protein